MIISGGFNVFPREVEEVLYSHPAVLECAVIGVPHPEWGEAVEALVALKEGMSPSAEELLAFCRHRLSSFKRPRSIGFVEEIPRNPSGKVLKRVLRRRRAGNREKSGTSKEKAMSNESSTLKRAGSIARRLHKLPYEKRVCRGRAVPILPVPGPHLLRAFGRGVRRFHPRCGG